MGIKAPIFICMLLYCKGEEHTHHYSPEDMEHHLNTKHTSFFEQIVAEHDKVWVCLNLFGINNGNKHQEKGLQTNNQFQRSQETCQNEHSRSIEHKREHEGINNGNKHQEKRPQTNNQLQKSQETCQNEHRSIERKRKCEGINNGN
ncbi:14926_t:CDS:2 [Entrophospora sp. SA101]|nr:14926_t:CDS:2 [Entrophospora sp. SA101]